ncbi:hypothetical protein K1W54_14885 [Micromonospora sp. CPCC 205371]|nr:hypothetical protein [Micromonospora sp. CPCC 205371]
MGRAVDGGLWMYGLCDRCNRERQTPHEVRYTEFAGLFKGMWLRSLALSVPSPVTVPDVLFFPGAVARAVMMGMYAMNPALRGLFPGVADALMNEDDKIILPANLRLRLAIARGNRARISGGDGGCIFRPFDSGSPLLLTSFGSIYFPPLAWQLVPDEAPLIDHQSWGDVSSWLKIDPAEEHLFSTVCQLRLPLVMHPSHDPMYRHLLGGTAHADSFGVGGMHESPGIAPRSVVTLAATPVRRGRVAVGEFDLAEADVLVPLDRRGEFGVRGKAPSRVMGATTKGSQGPCGLRLRNPALPADIHVNDL